MSRLYKPKAGFWIRFCVLLIVPFDGIAFRLRWRHLDRMPDPDDTGVIIVINHISYIDTVLVARLVWQSGRIPRFLVKSTLFELPVLRRILVGTRQIPVHRGTTEAAKSIGAAEAALADRQAIIMYAEGTITKDPDQWPMEAKTGVARLVLDCPGIPVVPIGQWGVQKVRKRTHSGSRLRWFTRRVHQASVGEPIDLSEWAGAEPTPEVLREITDTIMIKVRDEVGRLRGETPPTAFFKRPEKPRATELQ